jgi:hypothetical protein
MNSLLAKSRAGFYIAAAPVLAFAASPAMAGLKEDATTQMKTTGDAAYGGTAPVQSLPQMIGRIIGVVLTLLGVILVVLIIYAGFLWMTAQGEVEKTKKAKAILGNAIIGMVLIFAAYSIASFVIDKLVTATAG